MIQSGMQQGPSGTQWADKGYGGGPSSSSRGSSTSRGSSSLKGQGLAAFRYRGRAVKQWGEGGSGGGCSAELPYELVLDVEAAPEILGQDLLDQGSRLPQVCLLRCPARLRVTGCLTSSCKGLGMLC